VNKQVWRLERILNIILKINIFSLQMDFLGMFSNSLDDAYLVIPRKVNINGELISHQLNHHHEHYHYDVESDDPSTHAIHYQIDLQNETLHIELE
jgi:Reprolysin family propeptide